MREKLSRKVSSITKKSRTNKTISKKLTNMPSRVGGKKGEYPQTYCSFISILKHLHVSYCTEVDVDYKTDNASL